MIPNSVHPYKVLFHSSLTNAFPTANRAEFSTKPGSKANEGLGVLQRKGKELSLILKLKKLLGNGKVQTAFLTPLCGSNSRYFNRVETSF